MEPDGFERLSRRLAAATTRRGMLKVIAGCIAGATAVAVLRGGSRSPLLAATDEAPTTRPSDTPSPSVTVTARAETTTPRPTETPAPTATARPETATPRPSETTTAATATATPHALETPRAEITLTQAGGGGACIECPSGYCSGKICSVAPCGITVSCGGTCCDSFGDVCIDGYCCTSGGCCAGPGTSGYLCCDNGQVFCHGVCCAVGQTCGNGQCGACPDGGVLCEGACCPTGQTCVSDPGFGSVCLPAAATDCGSGQCPPQTACQQASGTYLCCGPFNQHCCEVGQTICGDTCCDAGDRCASGVCLPPGASLCSNGEYTFACLAGTACVNQTCVAGEICGPVTCTPNQSCSVGVCCPNGQVGCNNQCCAVGQVCISFGNVGPPACGNNCAGGNQCWEPASVCCGDINTTGAFCCSDGAACLQLSNGGYCCSNDQACLNPSGGGGSVDPCCAACDATYVLCTGGCCFFSEDPAVCDECVDACALTKTNCIQACQQGGSTQFCGV
jgi:hypothetical protein